MATYTIVSANQSPLGSGEINAGGSITVSPGDIYIVAASADADITFASPGGGPHDFDVVFNDSSSESFKVIVGGDLTPTVTIADNADLGAIDIDAQTSDGLTLNIGDNASLGKLTGSAEADTITVGDGFSAQEDWKMGDGDDVLSFGDNASLKALKTGIVDDAVSFGNGAQFGEIDTEDGDDTIQTGSNEQIETVDGGGGYDSYTTQTAGTNPSNVESTAAVCFSQGSLIRTRSGNRPVETLKAGDQVWTSDHGFLPLRWIGRFEVSAEALRQNPSLHPVRIRAGALGPSAPERDLYVSQQHRLLLRSRIVERMFATPEILVAAKKRVGFPGVEIVPVAKRFAFVHFALRRHEIVICEGVETESMLIAAESLKTLGEIERSKLCAALEFDARPANALSCARPIIRQRAAIEKLLERSQKNGKNFQEPSVTTILAQIA